MTRILLSAFLLVSTFVSAQKADRPAATTTSNSLMNGNSTTLVFDEKENYVGGFARVLKAGKFGFVNTSNELICNPAFDDARNFKNGLCAVKQDEKWGFINRVGKLVIPCVFEIAFDFNSGRTIARRGASWVIIDQLGVELSRPDIDGCLSFTNSVAIIWKADREGTLDLNGKIVFNGPSSHAVSQPRVNNSQNLVDCPDNIDFEFGSFTNWNCFTGRVDSVGNVNRITVSPSAPVLNRHRIINRVLPSPVDPYGLFEINPPDGSNHAVKLGNTRIGGESERIQYVLHVPLNDSNFSIRYDYAVVFQDPGHTAWTQPRFTAKLFDSAANAYISCGSFEYIATSNLPGFAVSSVDSSVIYKPWASAFISLRGHGGKTLYLEFTTADCVRKGHWGYAYVDVQSACSHGIDMNFSCASSAATLSGPPGFQTYNWWNNSFTSILATGQTATIDPAPYNSTIWLELVPFSEFGCQDTIPVHVTATFNPHFNSSASLGICTPHRFTFQNQEQPSTAVAWDFGDGTNGTGDTISHSYQTPGTYIVTMNVTLPSGCHGVVTDTVTVANPSGGFDFNGGNYCGSPNIQFNATTTYADSLHWDFGDGSTLVTTAASVSHTYLAAGTFTPVLTLISAAGCEIRLPGNQQIKIENISAGFSITERRHCGSTTVTLADTSSSVLGIASSAWNFGDGTNGVGNQVQHEYTTSGNYNITLVVTGISGCLDTLTIPVQVEVNENPSVEISGPMTVCPQTQVLLNSVSNGTEPLGTYNWSTQAAPGSNASAYNFTLADPGVHTIFLVAGTTAGCFDTASYTITVKSLPELQQPQNIQVCNAQVVDSSAFASSMTGSSFSWVNNDTGIGLASSGSGNVPAFTALNTSSTTVVAELTVTANADGCIGDPKTFTVTILPSPSPLTLADQILCNRDASALVVFNSFAGAIAAGNYTWTNTNPGIGLGASGAGIIPSFNAINNDTIPVIAPITITGVLNGCSGLPQTMTFTINPTPNIIQPSNISICNGNTSGIITFSSTISSSNFTWLNDDPSIGISTTGLNSIPVFTGINATMLPQLANITVNANAFGCNSTPVQFTITVNPTPNVVTPANQQVCTGAATLPVLFQGSVTGTEYSWTNNVPSIGIGAAGTGDILSFNPSNTSNSDLLATISVTPTINGCLGSPETFTFTVRPSPILIQPLNQFQCNGQFTMPVNPVSNVGGTTFNWTNSLPSIGLTAQGSGNIPSFITTNTTNVTVTATISITPATNVCIGQPKTFTIAVDPSPSIVQPLDQSLCRGETVQAINFEGGVAGTNFSWINSAANIGLASSGTGDIASFVALNNTAFTITSLIQVTGTANSCGSDVEVFTITIHPSPVVDPTTDQTICNGRTTTPIALTGAVANTMYSWKNDRPDIGLPLTGTGDIPAFNAINAGTASITANIIVFGTNSVCTMAIDTFTFMIHPSPVVSAGNDLNVCLGSTVQISASGTGQLSWSPQTGLSCSTCPNPTVTIQDSVRYFLTATSAEGCTNSDSVLLMVRRPFTMSVLPDISICPGGAAQLTAGNAHTYSWSPASGLNSTNSALTTASPVSTTQYNVIGQDAYGCFSDTGSVTVTVHPQPQVELGPELVTTPGTSLQLMPSITNGPVTGYSWQPANGLSCDNCPTPTVQINGNAVYALTVVNRFGCSAVDSIFVRAFCQKAQVFVPNAFTPDGDGLNDLLMIRGSGISVKSFRVFNRWGNLVFERQNFAANDPKYAWDGKIKSVPATPEVYIYTAEVICDNGTVYTYKGNTTIIK